MYTIFTLDRNGCPIVAECGQLWRIAPGPLVVPDDAFLLRHPTAACQPIPWLGTTFSVHSNAPCVHPLCIPLVGLWRSHGGHPLAGVEGAVWLGLWQALIPECGTVGVSHLCGLRDAAYGSLGRSGSRGNRPLGHVVPLLLACGYPLRLTLGLSLWAGCSSSQPIGSHPCLHPHSHGRLHMQLLRDIAPVPVALPATR